MDDEALATSLGVHGDVSGRTLLALLPVLVLLLGLIVYALADLLRAPSVRFLPKPLWAVVILLVSAPFGALAYLVIGRNRDGEVNRTTDAPDQTGELTSRTRR
jgi:Phospholipase_D-nuclease N-terminal